MIKSYIGLLIKRNNALLNFFLGAFIKFHNYSYHKISEYASCLNNNIHPKHKITHYHQFFIDRVSSDDIILDLGCGNGFLSYDIAKKVKRVIGIDIKDYNIKEAKKRYRRDNLEFVIGDATNYHFDKRFDKIVLSNVLEHIKERIIFLKKLRVISQTIILRVPMENRDWLVVYKKQHGFEYRSDMTHYIEYTLDSLRKELEKSGWRLDYYQINWGELWGVLKAV